MGLHQRRRFERPGLPEVVGIALVVFTGLAALLWWQGNTRPRLLPTSGKVVECSMRLTHYNATAMRNKVAMTYEYSVGGARHTGSWEGFWPVSDSPNALPPDEVPSLQKKGYPLVVLYEPGNPGSSSLHQPLDRVNHFRRMTTCILGAVTLLYLAIGYPSWKRRGRPRF